MHGFLIERLFPTGWRRDGQLWWRYADALTECERALGQDFIRGVRILAVRIQPEAIHEELASREGQEATS